MTIFALDELKNLVQNSEYPCVSLYLPMASGPPLKTILSFATLGFFEK